MEGDVAEAWAEAVVASSVVVLVDFGTAALELVVVGNFAAMAYFEGLALPPVGDCKPEHLGLTASGVVVEARTAVAARDIAVAPQREAWVDLAVGVAETAMVAAAVLDVCFHKGEGHS